MQTDLVARPTSNSSQLSKKEKIAGVPELLRKVSWFRPLIVCFIGKEIGEAVNTAIRDYYRKNIPMLPGPIIQTKVIATKSASLEIIVNEELGQSPLVSGALGFRFMAYKMVHSAADGSCPSGKTVSPLALPVTKEAMIETFFFAAPSTSGLVTHYKVSHIWLIFNIVYIQHVTYSNHIKTIHIDTGSSGIIPVPSK